MQYLSGSGRESFAARLMPACSRLNTGQSKFGFSMIAYIALSTMKEFVYFGIDLHFSVRSIRKGFIIL